MITSKRIRKTIVSLISVVISYLVANIVRFGYDRPIDPRNMLTEQGGIFLFISFLFVLLVYPFDKPHSGNRAVLRHFKDSVVVNITALSIFVVFIYISHTSSSVSRGFFICFFLVNCVVMFLAYRFLKLVKKDYEQTHKKMAVVFADYDDVLTVMHNIVRYGADDVQIKAIIVDRNNNYELYRIDYDEKGHSKISEFDKDYNEFIKREIVDYALIAAASPGNTKTQNLVKLFESMGVPCLINYYNFDIVDFGVRSYNYGMIRTIEVAPRFFYDWELMLKRVIDIIGGIVGCILCVIIGLFVAPAIVIEDGFPFIFKQTRVGKNGRFFDFYKFRSMFRDAEERKKDLMKNNEMNGLMFKMENDPRITKVGKFIRKTSLDEFPQFFSILKGDMSLVGTRPPTVDEYNKYSNHHKRRLSLKPGLTGMWQVSGRSNITDFEEIVKLDCYYIDNWSIILDIKILIMTVVVVFTGKGSK